MKLSCGLALIVTLGISAIAVGQPVSFDFEGLTSLTDLTDAGWVFHDDLTSYLGTISLETNIVHSGSQALRMGYRDLAYYPLNGQFGTLDLWAWDAGNKVHTHVNGGKVSGPTFGLGKDAHPDPTHPNYDPATHPETEGLNSGIGAGLLDASFLDSDGGYAYEAGDTTHRNLSSTSGTKYPLAGWSGNQSWHSGGWLGGGRPGTPYDGVSGGGWNHWSITYETSGQVTIQLLEGTGTQTGNYAGAGAFDGVTPGGVDTLFLYGGRNAVDSATSDATYFGDGIFDDITWTPVASADRPGDADGDGDIDLDDFVILKQNFLTTLPADQSMGDFDGDGDVDLDDFVILKQNFLTAAE